MSKIIASAAIRGAHKIVDQAEKKWQQAMDKWGANEPVGFPNTAYYLPVIYGIMGMKVEKLGDMEEMYGGKWAFEPDPLKAAHLMIEHIDKKRKALGIDKARERVLYDMAMRRELDAV